MSTIGGTLFLENGPSILRNTNFTAGGCCQSGNLAYNNEGWRKIPSNHQYFDELNVRFYDYLTSPTALPLGYQIATHYHVESN